MARRRQFGTVRQLTSGRWQVRHRIHDGPLTPAPMTFPTEKAAETYLSALHTDLVRGTWQRPDRGTVTVEVWLTRWIEQRKLGKVTRSNYRKWSARYIVPQLGRYPLRVLDGPAVRSWYFTLVDDIRGRNAAAGRAGDGLMSAAQAYRLLRAALNTAVEDELIDRNPCRIPGAATPHAAERPTASVAEVMALAALMNDDVRPGRQPGRTGRYRAVVLLAAFSGLRIAELRALRVGDVTTDAGQVAVRVRQRATYIDGVLDEDKPKTAAGVRTVPLPDVIGAELAAHIGRYCRPVPDARLFGSASGQPLGSSFDHVWARARGRIGRDDLRVHDLRHTGATLASLAGATEREVQSRIGHASASAARIYQHTTVEHGRAVAEQMGVMLADPKVVPLRPRRAG